MCFTSTFYAGGLFVLIYIYIYIYIFIYTIRMCIQFTYLYVLSVFIHTEYILYALQIEQKETQVSLDVAPKKEKRNLKRFIHTSCLYISSSYNYVCIHIHICI